MILVSRFREEGSKKLTTIRRDITKSGMGGGGGGEREDIEAVYS